jgi:signal transduction histidine kinase/CheY-like chemotaxis protein
MKLSKASISFSLLLLCTLGINAYVTVKVDEAYNKLVKAETHHKLSMQLITDLRTEVYQLAQLVRLYTATGETRYLFYYYDLISIRNGVKAIPENYEPNVYWDELIAQKGAVKALKDEGGISLSKRMEDLGFTLKELNTLNSVLIAIEELSELEQVAFAATQGLYDKETGQYISDGEPDIKYANELVFSEQYNYKKVLLSYALKALSSQVVARVDNEVKEASNSLVSAISRSVIIGIITFILIFITYLIFRKYVISPISKLSEVAEKLALGKYSTRVPKLKAADELIGLANIVDQMSNAIEQDIKSRVIVQEELEHANAIAQEATKTKSMFLANMSHEIRTPMNAIIGMTYLTLKTDLSPKQANYLETIYTASKSLLDIINNVLDFSKIEAGKTELEQSLFRIEDVVNNSLSIFKQSLYQREVELLVEIKNALLSHGNDAVIGDPVKLGQVFNNLLSNALKFTHSGHILFTIEEMKRDTEKLFVAFRIKDTGIGMTEHELKGLFKEFKQADSTITRRYGGTGLGLTISKSFAELMGGDIEVESTLQVGSVFTFTAEFLLPEKDEIMTDCPNLDRLKVLIVDDKEIARLVMHQMLSEFNVGRLISQGIAEASNGEEAITMLKKAYETGKPYDVVFLDWIMPGMDGAEFLSTLRENICYGEPEIVIVSSYDYDAMHDDADRFNIKHFLAKPVMPKALSSLFTSLLKANPQANPLDIINTSDHLEGMRILLVEDNQTNQLLAKELLELKGIIVDIANHGQEALDILTQHPQTEYHAVLMDLQMPTMDGYEAIKQIRAIADFKRLPIIVMSAHALGDNIEKALLLGANTYVPKPVVPEALYSSLKQFYKKMQPLNKQTLPMLVDCNETKLDIDGINTALGLKNSGDQPTLYKKVLINFFNDFKNTPNTLPALIEQYSWKEAALICHSLYGLAQTIGAQELTITAKKMEQACQDENGATAKNILPTLLSDLVPLLVNLEKMAFDDIPQKNLVSLTNVESTITTLKVLLTEGDVEVIEEWDKNIKLLSDTLPDILIAKIRKALNDFDFDQALVLLNNYQQGKYEE